MTDDFETEAPSLDLELSITCQIIQQERISDKKIHFHIGITFFTSVNFRLLLISKGDTGSTG